MGGVSYTIPNSTTGFRVTTGPIQLTGETADPERMYSLTSAGEGEISGNRFTAGNRSYTLSDQVLVYERRGSQYYLSSLARAESGGFTLTAWYDKAESEGGRIRVIVARAD